MPLTAADKLAGLSPEEQARALELLQAPPPDPDNDPEPTVDEDGFAELVDFYDDTLKLRYGGHAYVIHAPDAELGLLCQQIIGVGLGALTGSSHVGQRAVKAQTTFDAVLDDDSEEALYLRLLGGDQDHPLYDPEHDVWAQLKANGAPFPIFRHMGRTAFVWAGYNRETALQVWLDGARPKARPEAPKTDSTPEADEAPSTPSPDSGSGTKTRPRKRAAGTAGPKSGRTGG